MIDNFKNTAVVLLTLSLIDGVINVAEWLTAMDVYKTTLTTF
jgi:hypothetical protein